MFYFRFAKYYQSNPKPTHCKFFQMSLNRLFLMSDVAMLLISISSCEKTTQHELPPPIPVPSAGKDVHGINEFQVKLDADSLLDSAKGRWTIISGMVDKKVFFDNEHDPKTYFNGLPGETYELEWNVKRGATETKSTVKISFKPLVTSIINITDGETTRFHLKAKNYDRGEWTIDARYAHIVAIGAHGLNESFTSSEVRFQGYQNTAYTLIWTTYYGSKSASDTIQLATGSYSEKEALEDLGVHNNPYRVKFNEEGRVTELDLGNHPAAFRIMQDTLHFPTIQVLTSLKRLNAERTYLSRFPEVFGAKYKDLEYLFLDGNEISFVPENIGKLTKLKQLHMSGSMGKEELALPESFGNLKNLEMLHLENSNLRVVPANIGHLSKLKELKLSSNRIDALPESIVKLKQWEKIRVFTYRSLPESVSSLTRLKELRFITSDKNARLPQQFGNLKSLQLLHLDGNYQSLPPSFSGLTDLEDLNIVQLGQLPEGIGKLKKLKNIYLVGSFTKVPESLSELTLVENLVLEEIGRAHV